jgi:hypothetical protein
VDLKKPLVYLETSRGCPFSCAFCMSSIETGVRSFSLERIKHDLLLLMKIAFQPSNWLTGPSIMTQTAPMKYGTSSCSITRQADFTLKSQQTC